MRTVNGMKVAFVSSESYFQGMHTPSMCSTAKDTGADIVLLLAEGKTEADLSDDESAEILCLMQFAKQDGGASDE